MANTRVYQIAKELELSNEEMIERLNKIDITVDNKDSELDADQ